MSYRTHASRLARGGAGTLLAGLATLAFAQVAQAQPTVVYTPTNAAALQSAVSSADGAAAGTLSIIEVQGNTHYIVTAPLLLSGDIELTGPPTYQTPPNTTHDPQINGQQVFVNDPTSSLIIVQPNAQVVLKGFDVQSAGTGPGVGAVEIAGTAEIDNVGVDGNSGTGLLVDSTGTVTATNSSFSDGNVDGVEEFGTATFINDDIVNNAGGGIEANGVGSGTSMLLVNSVVAHNAGIEANEDCFGLDNGAGDGLTTINDYIDDSTCNGGGTGITQATDTQLKLPNGGTFNGGPTKTLPPGSGSLLIGHGASAFCPPEDQRFFLYTGSPCDVGDYQTTALPAASQPATQATVAGPTCSVATVSEGTDPEFETVNASDAVAHSGSGVGLGPDTIGFFTQQGYTGPDPLGTSNGTLSWPTLGPSSFLGATWLAETDPTASDPSELDLPSTASFPVTATKPVGNTNTTFWSFDATNWLGVTTYCH
jgi:hypothetical protein